MNFSTNPNSLRVAFVRWALSMGLAAIPFLLSAQVDHSPRWVSSTNLTYSLVDLDNFPQGSFGYCRWGNFMDSNSIGEVDLKFSWLTAPPYNNANTDLFITPNAGLLQRVLYNGQQFPSDALWTAPASDGTSSGLVEFEAANNDLDLFRYLHFRTPLIDDSNNAAVPSSARKLVILFHGWNPDSNRDSYATATGEFAALTSALRSALANTDWRLVRYHWEADADTGGIDLGTNPTEAAEISNLHGQHLGELLAKSFPNLEKIQLIAHSDGTWAARSTARYILKNLPTCAVQVTLLDPFMPTAIGVAGFFKPDTALGDEVMNVFDSVEGNQQLKTLENYFSDDGLSVPGTQETFAWDRPMDRGNVQVNGQFGSAAYSSHAGPIKFYADTVNATLPGQLRAAALAPFNIGPTSAFRLGWTRSLFYNEPLIQQNPQSQTIVAGSVVTLSTAAASRNSSASDANTFSYQWRKSGIAVPSATSATLRINSVQVADAGPYTVTVSNAWGATTSSAATLSIVQSLIIALQPKSQTLTVGSSLTLSVGPFGGTGSFTYQWRFNGAPLLNGASSTYTATNIGTGFTGTFDVVVSDGVSSVTSAPAAITVVVGGVAPTVVAQPQNQTANAGQTIVFSVAAGGSPAPIYQWSKGGVTIVGATAATLTLNNVQPGDAGSYTVFVSNSAGSLTSNSATLTINVPPIVTTQPVSRTVAPGAGTTFSVSAIGTGTLSYQWRKDGVPIVGATSATFTLNGPQPGDAGTYTVVISGIAGNVTSAAAVLTVLDPGRLINLSVLTAISPAVPNFTVATVLGPTGTPGTRPLLVRAVGPSLSQLSVPGLLADPKLDFYFGSALLNSNDNWGGTAPLRTAITQTGAFPLLSDTSKDAALSTSTTTSGSYSVIVSGIAGATGNVIAEIYDGSAGTFSVSTPRLVNVSVLQNMSAGSTLTLGFTVGGSLPLKVLIRAIGPGLAAVGVTNGTMADPQITLFNSSNAVVKSNNDWSGDTSIAAAAAQVGAFLISSATSKDAMLLVTLPPGGYTAQASGVGGTSGFVIVEVYEVP